MSFSADFILLGISYPIRRLQWSITQNRDQLGRPNAVAYGGQLQVEIDSTRDEVLVNWMFSPRKKLDGQIRLRHADSRATLKTIEFKNAFCVLLKGSFDANSNELSMTKSLLISAEHLLVGEVEVVNHWPA